MMTEKHRALETLLASRPEYFRVIKRLVEDVLWPEEDVVDDTSVCILKSFAKVKEAYTEGNRIYVEMERQFPTRSTEKFLLGSVPEKYRNVPAIRFDADPLSN